MDNSLTATSGTPIQPIFTPMEIASLFREQLRSSGKLILIEGIYIQNERSLNYSGYFYDSIRGTQDSYEIAIRVPYQIRSEIKSGMFVQLCGTISKELRNNGMIQIAFTVTRHQIIKENVISDEEMQLLEALQTKGTLGFKNVDAVLEKILYRGERPKVCLIFAKSSITDTDFKKGMESATSHINFEVQNVSFTNIPEFIKMLKAVDLQRYDVLAVIRGGGQGLETFRNIELVQVMIHLTTPLISAVGHPEEKPFISRIADKDTATPSLLGTYFKDLVNRVIEERSKSKAILVGEVQKQYQERLNVQESQNKALNEKIKEMSKIQEETVEKNHLALKGLQDTITQMTNAQKQATLESEKKNKTIDEQIRSMNRLNEDLTKELSRKNQSENKQSSIIAQQTEKINSLERELSQKKGCMPGCLGMAAVITGIIILILQ